jgi:ArsR family transcriptional regulator
MTKEERIEILTEKANKLKALAHPTRLLIIEELMIQERCVNDFKDLIGCEMATISNHLKVLRKAGYIDKEKRGLQVYYFLVKDCVKILLGCLS